MSKQFYVIKRNAKRGYLYYVRFEGEKTKHSTGCRTRADAEEWARNHLGLNRSGQTLAAYLEPFFTDGCPHVRRLRDEQKSIGSDYIRDQRARIDKHVLGDVLADMNVAKITRGDILDFRTRLVDRGVGERTINRVIGVLKTAFKEGVYRQELTTEPSAGIGNINYARKEIGTFTAKELRLLFSQSPEPFRDHVEFTIFLAAAGTGMRRGELLALSWRQISLESGTILVDRAMKTRMGEIGTPKWDRSRTTYLSGKCTMALRQLKRNGERVMPEDLVFGYADGTIRKSTWWRNSFVKAMKVAGFDRVGRNLRPHSFRHSLATLLAEAQADPLRVRTALGWSGPEIQKNYTHAGELSMDALRDATNEILGGT